jgi:hypothetical protein
MPLPHLPKTHWRASREGKTGMVWRVSVGAEKENGKGDLFRQQPYPISAPRYPRHSNKEFKDGDASFIEAPGRDGGFCTALLDCLLGENQVSNTLLLPRGVSLFVSPPGISPRPQVGMAGSALRCSTACLERIRQATPSPRYLPLFHWWPTHGILPPSPS